MKNMKRLLSTILMIAVVFTAMVPEKHVRADVPAPEVGTYVVEVSLAHRSEASVSIGKRYEYMEIGTFIEIDEVSSNQGYYWGHIIKKNDKTSSGWAALQTIFGDVYARRIEEPTLVENTFLDDCLALYADSISDIVTIMSLSSNKEIIDFCNRSLDYIDYAKIAATECYESCGKIVHNDPLLSLYTDVHNYYNGKHTKKNRESARELLDVLFEMPKLILIEQDIKAKFGKASADVNREEFKRMLYQAGQKLKLLTEGEYFNRNNTCCGYKNSGHFCDDCNLGNILKSDLPWIKGALRDLNLSMFNSGYIPKLHTSTGSNMSYGGWSCFGFGLFAQFYIYQLVYGVDYGEVNFTGEGLMFCDSGITKDIALNNLLPGDAIRTNKHTYIVLNVNPDGIDIIEANNYSYCGGENCKISTQHLNWNHSFLNQSVWVDRPAQSKNLVTIREIY